jgi:methyl-accepting chemotaxis protein
VLSAFQAAASHTEASLEDLFDPNYRPVARSYSLQFITRFTAFIDRVLPAVQELGLAVDLRDMSTINPC